ncbi:hypothetical protein WMY93_010539 [Mugilogobius chulae]|uniref:Sarcoglycan alpha n=1 Tax=Mugilogobius chulae TaxID=88201 RepID=A0AAW0P8U9_9GOBI
MSPLRVPVRRCRDEQQQREERGAAQTTAADGHKHKQHSVLEAAILLQCNGENSIILISSFWELQISAPRSASVLLRLHREAPRGPSAERTLPLYPLLTHTILQTLTPSMLFTELLDLILCAASVLGANAEFKFTVPVGRLFTYELMRETFLSDFEPLSKLYAANVYDDPVVFKCKLQNFPDLPEWLRFTQRHPYDNGFLYGTPMVPGKSIIEVWAVNKKSYQTTRQIVVIKAVEEKILPYQAEFFIKLREIEKVLPPTVQSEIKADLQRLWDTEALEIVNITNALDRGGRVPLPLAGHFEGVYVKVGSEQDFSKCLLKVLSPEHSRQCSEADKGVKVKVPGECNFCSIPSNCITWCKTQLFDLSNPTPAPPAPLWVLGSWRRGETLTPLSLPRAETFSQTTL